MSQQTLNLAAIGNCQISALINTVGRIAGMSAAARRRSRVLSLLGGDSDDGYCDVDLVNLASSEQRYERNTAIVETLPHDSTGGTLRIRDFCPRHRRFNRMFGRLFNDDRSHRRTSRRKRQSYPLGSARDRTTVRRAPAPRHGSNHVRFEGNNLTLRLTNRCGDHQYSRVNGPSFRPVVSHR